MASRKTLKSVSRAVADSFTSLMNYRDGDYVLGHILTAARQSGETTLEVDLLSGRATPEQLLTSPVLQSVQRYCDDFSDLVRRNGSDANFVVSARLNLQFDTSQAIPVPHTPSVLQSPYVCTALIEDDRGKVYESLLDGWWYPEP